MSIEIRNVSKTFGRFKALKDVSLRVETGELVALLGPSGSGKTTLLRIIAGLEQADPGNSAILMNDIDVTSQEIARRRVGFVFQHYALFRHMTVAQNVSFGLRVRPCAKRPSKSEIHDRVAKLLKLVQLEQLAGRYPSQLSGGQRQRVALARALAVEPQVLLLDEPFGALDAKVRRELRQWLRRLHDEVHVTSVFVTHDQEEAMEVSDRVAVMNTGQIEQIGTPDEVYDQPATPFVYNFLGNVNLFHGRLQKGQGLQIGKMQFPVDAKHDVDHSAIAYVRPHDIDLKRLQNGKPGFNVRIRHINSAGPIVRILADQELTGEKVEIELTRERFRELNPQVGELVFAEPKSIRLFVDDYSI